MLVTSAIRINNQSLLDTYSIETNSTMTDLLRLMSIITPAYMLARLAVGRLGLAARSVPPPENGKCLRWG